MEAPQRNQPTNKDLKERLSREYLEEKMDMCRQNKTFPRHLYTFRVYCAYKNVWRLVNREKLKPDEMQIMISLGCYRPSRKEFGITSHRTIAIQTDS
jgi:hypothetical protein